ncbi:ribosylnicotinamide kinase, partial [Ascosphaera acerosa]
MRCDRHDRIPLVKLPSGEEVADWDVTDAINLVDLRNALAHVRQHGCLPPTHRSKEDLNQQTDAGVAASDIARLRDDARARLDTVLQGRRLTLPILEGFLLFAPP